MCSLNFGAKLQEMAQADPPFYTVPVNVMKMVRTLQRTIFCTRQGSGHDDSVSNPHLHSNYKTKISISAVMLMVTRGFPGFPDVAFAILPDFQMSSLHAES